MAPEAYGFAMRRRSRVPRGLRCEKLSVRARTTTLSCLIEAPTLKATARLEKPI